MTDIQGRCPACRGNNLFLGNDGYITCSRLDCPRPDLVTELLGKIADARQHGAFTFCEQSVGHATMREFATKIAEKRNALGQREEAVRYANEQKQRAETAERQRDQLAALAHEILYTTHNISSHDWARWRETLDTITDQEQP